MILHKVIAIVGLFALLALTSCGKNKEEEISADEILGDEAVKGAEQTTDKSGAMKEEKFSEPENLSASKKKGGAALKKEVPAAKRETLHKTADLDGSYTPSFSEGGRFVVQCNVFASAKAAQHLADKLTEKNYPAYVAEVQNPKPEMTGIFYRVRVGNFSGLTAARAFGENVLTPMGYEYWIDNKNNDNSGGGTSSSYGTSPYGTSSYGGSESTTPSSTYESSTTTPSYSTPESTTPPPVPETYPSAPATQESSYPSYTPAPETPAAEPVAPAGSGTEQPKKDQNFDF